MQNFLNNFAAIAVYNKRRKNFQKNLFFSVYFIDDIVNRDKIQVNDGQARFIHLCLTIDFLRGR
jgi:hypothetical protein